MSLKNDFTVGLRQVRKHPGSALLAIIAYAFGLSVVGFMLTMIFGILKAHPDTVEYDELTFLRWDPSTKHLWQSGAQTTQMRYPDFKDIYEQQESFASLAAFRGATFNVVINDFAERFKGNYVTADYFRALALKPQVGQFFVTGDDAPSSPKKAVLSDTLWRNEFNANESIVGTHLTLNGLPTEIIGVAPPDSDLIGISQIWVNETINPLAIERTEGNAYQIFGQLKKDRSTLSAMSELNAIANRLAAKYPETNTGYIAVELQNVTDIFLGKDIVRVFYLAFGCSLLVLLIACTNVANLTLARATTRIKELAIRASLGGSRRRLINQMLVEGFAIALIGGLAGLLLTIWATQAFWSWVSGNPAVPGVPSWINLDIDLRAIAALLLITLLASVVASIVPALKASRANVNEILKDSSRSSSGMQIGLFSKLLAFFQLFISCGLLITTSALVSTAEDANDFAPPYDPAGLMVARFDIPETYSQDSGYAALLSRLQNRLEASPALDAVGFSSSLDMVKNWNSRWDVRGREKATADDFVNGRHEIVSDNYFETMGIPILQGRGFTTLDAGESAEQTCVINEPFARTLWPDQTPIGKQIRDVSKSSNTWITVVGVVPDTQMAGPGQHDDASSAGVYRPLSSDPQTTLSVFAKTNGNPLLQAQAIRAVFQEELPNVAIYRIKTVAEAVEESNFRYRFFLTIFGFFGIAALVLASIGVYGVMNFSVRQRFQEFGIRQALGANRLTILGHVFHIGIYQIAIGIGLGSLLGFALVSLIGQAMGNLNATALTYAIPVSVIISISVIALLTPALEATRTNLANALRDE